MNLLSKIQNKLKGEPAATTAGSPTRIEELNNLPDSEKLQVLDFLVSIKDLLIAINE